ncbi:hypothetical protein AB5N19_05751 [Seiridium cardinale]
MPSHVDVADQAQFFGAHAEKRRSRLSPGRQVGDVQYLMYERTEGRLDLELASIKERGQSMALQAHAFYNAGWIKEREGCEK